MHKKFGLILFFAFIVCFTASACARQTQAPVRHFTTSDLLIQSLPGWEIHDGPAAQPTEFFNLRGAVAGSTVRFVRWFPNSRLWPGEAMAEQWMVQFQFVEDAAQAYHDHYFPSAVRGEPLKGFNYVSRVANQFRVVCDTGPLSAEITVCFVEAQYQEFYTFVNYQTSNRKDAIDDLSIISETLDHGISRSLGLKQ